MSAADTARNVLVWARAERPASPPVGDLAALDELASPSTSLQAAMCCLVAVTTAQLRLDTEPGPVAPELALLAAAVGGRQSPRLAAELLAALPVARSPLDCIAYHGVARHVLRAAQEAQLVDQALRALIRSRSPLTALLDYPTAQERMWCESLLDRMLELGGPWRRLLTLAIAQPPASIEQLKWRGDLLDMLRLDEVELVLDVYETALRWHRPAHLALLKRADVDLRQMSNLETALATAALWEPLSAIERSMPDAVRRRRHLPVVYLDALRLARRARAIVGPIA